MIKFYKDDLSAMVNLTGLANAICFATDRGTLLMGGKEYGRDKYSVHYEANATGYDYKPTGARTVNDADVAAGTLYADTKNHSIWIYNGNSTWAADPVIPATVKASELAINNKSDGTLSTAVSGEYLVTAEGLVGVAQNLESKVSGAYAAGTALSASQITDGTNNILVSKDGGIQKTEYTLPHGNISAIIADGQPASGKAALSTTLVNAQTLAAVYEDVKSQAVTLTSSVGPGSGFITWEPDDTLTGTLWTPTFHVKTGKESGALVNNAGTLEVKMAIRQKATAEGYLATYGLFNEAGGTGNDAVQLGADINLVKDQFIKSASYVRGVTKSGVTFEYLPAANVSGTAYTSGYYKNGIYTSTAADKLSGDEIPVDEDAANRYLKLVFALKREGDKGDTEGDPSGQINNNTANDDDSYIYIDVNELFDSYIGVSGVAVNQTTNEISGVVDGDTEAGTGAAKHYSGKFLTVGANGFAVNGIKNEITGYIQDIGTTAITGDNTWLTNVGIDTTGKLSSACVSAYASGVNFNSFGLTAGSGAAARVAVTGTTVQDAFNSISNTIANMDYVIDGKPATNAQDQRYQYIYRIEQIDGKISAEMKSFDGSQIQVDSYASPNLDGINKKIYTISATTGEHGTLQAGLSSIVSSVYDAINAMNLAETGTARTFVSYTEATSGQDAAIIINQISESDGKVSASTIALDANHVTFSSPAAVATNASGLFKGINSGESNTKTAATVGAALSSIGAYITSLDVPVIGTVGAPIGDVSTTTYQVINQITQEDGKISANVMSLTDGNVYSAGISKVETGTSSVVRAAIAGTNVHDALDSISNTLADYMSFHDAAGNVI